MLLAEAISNWASPWETSLWKRTATILTRPPQEDVENLFSCVINSFYNTRYGLARLQRGAVNHLTKSQVLVLPHLKGELARRFCGAWRLNVVTTLTAEGERHRFLHSGIFFEEFSGSSRMTLTFTANPLRRLLCWEPLRL